MAMLRPAYPALAAGREALLRRAAGVGVAGRGAPRRRALAGSGDWIGGLGGEVFERGRDFLAG
ncbi:hypothetical protein I552_0485 [Mycobacterium xenopi 3993]|nr:hypothetical protein I552_0485 [Mycobacterium xenopi 3993]